MRNVTVFYGTESGNAQGLAERAGDALKERGFDATVVDMQNVDVASLPSLGCLLVITSTYGNGDPPSNAEVLHAHLMKKCGPLPNLVFSVCALGDTTYERFAQCGKDFDRRLEELGGKRFAPRVDCDADYEVAFDGWFARVVAELEAMQGTAAGAALEAAPVAVATVEAAPPAPRGTKRNPAVCKVIVNRPMSGPGASRKVHHLVLDTQDFPDGFTPGDSIGVLAPNAPALVEELLATLHLDGAATVDGGSLRDALTHQHELQELDVRWIELVHQKTGTASLTPEARAALTHTHHVIDLARQLGDARVAPAELLKCLRPLQPRLYSVASSPTAHPGEVHLMVGIVEYELHGTARAGVASRWIASDLQEGQEVRAFVQRAPSFRVAPRSEDMIMIGPGTGVAPYRGFLEERRREKGRGRAWLFFGARNEATDFYYREDWEALQREGLLDKLSLAFSRDQAEKVYVQHRMREERAELLDWLRDGAYFYVCGDAKHMAKDVHQALLDVLTQDQSPEEAASELAHMEREGRYLKDVY